MCHLNANIICTNDKTADYLACSPRSREIRTIRTITVIARVTVVGRGIPGILPKVLVKNTRDSPRTRTNVAVTDAIPDVYIHRTISNAWGARTNARGTVSSLLFFFLNGILLPRSLSLPRRKGWTERGAATKVSREALSVTKQAVLRDH